MPSMTAAPSTFLPKADAAILTLRHRPPPPPTRPQTIGPILDPESLDKPISHWSEEIAAAFYPSPSSPNAPTSAVCDKPPGFNDRYLRAFLADNERLRLSMLWYYTRDILKEDEFLAGLQEKAHLAQESTGWEFAVIGILDINVYIRLATVGLQLGILPRGETLCAHTVTQPPGSVFLLPALQEDWRFRTCPYLEQGGLYAYAGVPLRLQHESGHCVGLGSLCVASSKSEDPLTKDQQQALVRLADWVVSDLVQCARARRQRERHRMSELLSRVQLEMDTAVSEAPVTRILRTAYPTAIIKVQPLKATHVELGGRHPIPMSGLEGGLWEDVEYLDALIADSNHQALPTSKTVRVVAAACETASGPSLLMVGSKDFQLIFDDVDSWFVQSCAGMISQMWRKRLLVDAITAKEKFLRGFSHQLRTPVHGILGSADLLAEEFLQASSATENSLAVSTTVDKPPSSMGEYSKYLSIIKMGGRDLVSIINNMITLNRWVDIAMTERHYAMHDVDKLESELSAGILNLTVGDARYNSAIFFTHDYPPEPAAFWMDIDVLRDSLLPVLYNAVQHTPDGIVSVHSSIDPESRQLTVDIKDTGRGIHQDDQRRIFEPYEKVDVHSARAGLGLTLASRFATLLHGSVALMSSRLGRGSLFRATFCDVECKVSEERPLAQVQVLASSFKNLPRKFCNLSAKPNGGSLCDHFVPLLTSHGFTPSDRLDDDDCFAILDETPNVDKHIAQIPSGVICLVLSLGIKADPVPERTARNVIHASGPFSTSVLQAILGQADALLSETKSSELRTVQADEAQFVLVERPAPKMNGKAGDEINHHPTIDSSDSRSNLITTPQHSPGHGGVPRPLSTSARPTTLIVDDNIVNLRVMEMYCKKRRLPYLTAKDGQQAVEIFARRQGEGQESASAFAATGSGTGREEDPQLLPPIELIFMDLQMPVCDGIEATRQIRDLEERNKWSKSLILIMTGQDTVADKAAAKNAGGDEYFVKPVVIQQLDRVVRRNFPAFEVRKGP